MRALGLLSLLLAASAWAGRRRDVEAAPTTPPPSGPARAPAVDLTALPVPHGDLPRGLASLSPQACRACHASVYQDWASGVHRPQALPDFGPGADPRCGSCHRPSLEGPLVDALAHAQGVTCAACHVREGQILTAFQPEGPAPHPLTAVPALAEPEACATCHQLTWPGAEVPLYDTFGEWSRSGWAKAGVRCVDCHYAPGVDGGPPHHGLSLQGAGLTWSLRLSGATLVRGGDGVQVEVVALNTGAGHHVPSGSPFQSREVRLSLRPPDGGPLVEAARWQLGRRFDPQPPFTLQSDERIPAGGEWRQQATLQLPLDRAPGKWTLSLQVLEQGPGREPELLDENTLPITVD